MRLLEIDERLFAQVKKGIEYMLEKEDISSLCLAFSKTHGKERGVRDAIQGEVTFQEGMYSLALVIIPDI